MNPCGLEIHSLVKPDPEKVSGSRVWEQREGEFAWKSRLIAKECCCLSPLGEGLAAHPGQSISEPGQFCSPLLWPGSDSGVTLDLSHTEPRLQFMHVKSGICRNNREKNQNPNPNNQLGTHLLIWGFAP